jgi:hypothetical protein
MRQLDFVPGLAVIEVTLHLPVTEIELSLGAAMETRTISAPAMRERAAEVRVPATEYSRHEIAYLCHISPLVRIALVCLTRRAQPIWATKSTSGTNQPRTLGTLVALCGPFCSPRSSLYLRLARES